MTVPGDSPAAEWQPGASLSTLEFTADVRRRVRRYFDATGSLEVVTPVLSCAGPSEPAIEPFDTRATAADGRRWLQTSPEFAMKRLVACYGRDVWQLAPVFRRAEQGQRHNREFLLLEWYRVGQDMDELMQDVSALLRATVGEHPPFDRASVTVSYGDCVRQLTGQWPEALTVESIRSLFAARQRHFPESIQAQELDTALDLLFDTFVVSAFSADCPTFVTGYPPSQASLARLAVDTHGRSVASRFELYAGEVELANGFHELVDAAEQRQRFEDEYAERAEAGQVLPAMDEAFLAALEFGLPECSGVALGLDRLAMVALAETSLDAVMSFSDERT